MSNENDVLRQLLSEESRDHAREAEAAAIEEAAQVEALYAIVSAEEQQYEDLKALAKAGNSLLQNAQYLLQNAQYLRGNKAYAVDEHIVARLRKALEAAEVWFDDNDPRSMGWVNDRGLP